MWNRSHRRKHHIANSAEICVFLFFVTSIAALWSERSLSLSLAAARSLWTAGHVSNETDKKLDRLSSARNAVFVYKIVAFFCCGYRSNRNCNAISWLSGLPEVVGEKLQFVSTLDFLERKTK